MKRVMSAVALAFFVSMAGSFALAADLARTYERNFTPAPAEAAGCSCDAPSIQGLICATPLRCREMSGLCLGACVHSASDDAACSCDAPGIYGLVCATALRCREMSGLCEGRC